MNRISVTTVVTAFLILTVNISSISKTAKSLDLRMLSGQWQGQGEIIIPKTSVPVSIKGKAVFSFDSVSNRLKTAIEAGRFFFTYADSGYLWHDSATDSINWEVWDGFDTHRLFRGKMENNVITGTRSREGWHDRITVDFITSDSLSFRLAAVHKNGKVQERVTIDMWRVR